MVTSLNELPTRNSIHTYTFLTLTLLKISSVMISSSILSINDNRQCNKSSASSSHFLLYCAFALYCCILSTNSTFEFTWLDLYIISRLVVAIQIIKIFLFQTKHSEVTVYTAWIWVFNTRNSTFKFKWCMLKWYLNRSCTL